MGPSVDGTIPSGWERQIIGLLGHLPRRYIIIVLVSVHWSDYFVGGVEGLTNYGVKLWRRR